MTMQLDSSGKLRHLITLKDLDKPMLEMLLDRADSFVAGGGALPRIGSDFAGRTVANLFFEPSTRTRSSFELAAKRLGLHVLNLDVRTSSRTKGETILDTIYTLEAMSCDIFVLRDSEPGMPGFIADNVDPWVSVLNAGEADRNHPTQGLLDVLTMRQHKKDFSQLSVSIIGDIRHSRVAHSTSHALKTLGVGQLRLIAPESLMPDADEFAGAERHTDIATGIADADVVMTLRIQKERMNAAAIPDSDSYSKQYGLNRERLALAKPDAIVMHPGPMNRGTEISSEVADGPQSVIREQVANGVATRMAVMLTVLETLHGK
jgi:aspartate carbamoyltransferase catalytic subunit